MSFSGGELALRFLFTLIAAVILAVSTEASAHPHVLPSVQADLIFNSDGRMNAIQYIWLYDSAYSTFVGRDIDANKDGVISKEELNAFAKSQIDALGEHRYFTTIKTQTSSLELDLPKSYGVNKLDDGRLQLEFTIPLKAAAPVDQQITVELFDPDIFAYFTMANDRVRLIGAPQGCVPTVTGPQPIDLRNTRSIPAVFWDALNNGSKTAAQKLVNRIQVKCP